MEDHTLRVACYGRYSTALQREESISAQLRAMKRYCDENGWTIVRCYIDRACSGSTDNRPQFQKMIKDSDDHGFDIVLVHQLSRFARSRYDSNIYKNRLRKNGVRLCSVLEKIDDSPESILLEGLLEAINEFYIANIARESLKGLKENAYKALHNGGCPGLGYNVDKTRHLVVNEEEARIVAMIFGMYIAGYSCTQIADLLNEDGYCTKAGNPFTQTAVRTVLRNEKYTGIYIYNKREAKGYDHKRPCRDKPAEEIIRIEGGIPAIISRDIWEAAQQRLHRGRCTFRITKAMHLLSGKVRCGICGAVMQGTIRQRKAKEPFRNYVCRTKAAECDNFKEIDSDSLERCVIELVKAHCNAPATLYNVSQGSPPFRLALQSCIHSITVYKRTVIIRLYVNGEVRTFRRGRKAFRTPTQRCFI
ncbi:MAG: recombinase family protein [Oscillospiraceae bacterium]|nr:recombinase family protein [Oscillospiraceae bacterium]